MEAFSRRSQSRPRAIRGLVTRVTLSAIATRGYAEKVGDDSAHYYIYPDGSFSYVDANTSGDFYVPRQVSAHHTRVAAQ